MSTPTLTRFTRPARQPASGLRLRSNLWLLPVIAAATLTLAVMFAAAYIAALAA